ncbi:MAG: DUF456 family protein [Deltaproteobacteria bacterium]|nr:DUF456 family protein [Deltaproteobacteria bacterium]
MPHELVIALTVVLMLLGLAGSFLPMLPGSPLILAGAALYAWHTGFTVVGWTDLIVLAVLALAGQGLDYAASALGAKRYGGSTWGMIGACIGGALGLITANIIGLIVGSFAGAVVCELVKGSELKASMKVGYGTLVGFLCGALGKVMIAITMVGYFILQVWR